MNKIQQINKILHDHIDVDKNTDYTNYKKLITAIEEWHEQQVKSVDLANVVGQRELLLDFANYSESDKTSQTTDECVDNYLDSIK